jgi:uncharacterized protein YpmB
MDPITQTTPNQQQPAPVNPEHLPAQAGKKVGPIIATLVIILVLIIAALYIFASKISQRTATDQMTDQPAASQQTVQPVTNDSDDLNSIQADLNASTNGVDNQNF